MGSRARRNQRRNAATSAAGQNVRAKFDAAQTNDGNSKHWSMADNLSARGSNNKGVRQTLVKRSRYEVENNCWASGLVRTIAYHTIGSGPRLQILSDNEEANQRVEKAFASWAKQVGFAEKTLTAKETEVRDGEVFARLIENKSVYPINLDIKLHEADQCTSPLGTFLDPFYDDGLHLDRNGEADRYFFLDYHPGDPQYVPVFSGEWYMKKDVLHYFRASRPGQLRGIPALTPALPLFAILRRFTMATLRSAEFIASVTGFLKTQTNPELGPTPSARDFYSFAYESGMLMSLPEGWTVEQLTNIPLTTNYEQFLSAVLNEIARCVNVPYNVAACNSKGLNYSSGRMDHLVWDRDIEVDLSRIESKWCDPILKAWLEEASYIDGLLDGLGPVEEIQHQWCWDARPIIDEESDANASSQRIKTGQSTLPLEWQRRGYGDVNGQLRLGAQSLGLTVEQYQSVLTQSIFGVAPPAATPPATPVVGTPDIATPQHITQSAGAFVDTKRRDFTNNLKAIEDVTKALQNGGSRTMAEISYERLGLTPTQIEKLIAEASDGVVSQQEIEQVVNE